MVNGRLASPLPDGQYSISVITEIELLSFPGLSDGEELRIRNLLQSLVQIDLTAIVRDETVRLRRNYRLKIPDAIIAASALTQQAVLLTNDLSFASVEGLTCKSLQLR